MDALDPGRVIVRQNALAHAVNYHNNTATDPYTVSEIIATAREFEAYSCGDLDVAEAQAILGAEEG